MNEIRHDLPSYQQVGGPVVSGCFSRARANKDRASVRQRALLSHLRAIWRVYEPGQAQAEYTSR